LRVAGRFRFGACRDVIDRPGYGLPKLSIAPGIIPSDREPTGKTRPPTMDDLERRARVACGGLPAELAFSIETGKIYLPRNSAYAAKVRTFTSTNDSVKKRCTSNGPGDRTKPGACAILGRRFEPCTSESNKTIGFENSFETGSGLRCLAGVFSASESFALRSERCFLFMLNSPGGQKTLLWADAWGFWLTGSFQNVAPAMAGKYSKYTVKWRKGRAWAQALSEGLGSKVRALVRAELYFDKRPSQGTHQLGA